MTKDKLKEICLLSGKEQKEEASDILAQELEETCG